MRHPTRYLRDYVDAEMTPERQHAVEAHLARCASCRAAVAEERRLRSRLRALRVPAAGPDLAARIAGTAAATAERADQEAGGEPGNGSNTAGGAVTGSQRQGAPLDRRSHAVAAGVAVAAAAAMLLGGAYAAGTVLEVPPETGTRTAMAAGWEEVTGSGSAALSPDQLQSLRGHGWSCPELADLGLELESARSLQVQGHPAVEMVFAGAGERIRLVEQHPLPEEDRQPVVNAFTGHSVAADGFTALGSDKGPAVFSSDEHPGQTVVAAGSVTYTFESTMPVKSLPRAVEELSLLESSRLARPGAGAEPMERIARGLAVFARAGWSI
ncbi:MULTISPECIES: zf-HC2 domain-containing protein [unclassified Arthrobacter]|uniref:zf-HC2 domain-containing protein n=1 Tax=unclassified Arthrobacter TaxID=235627 RepID=UPI001D136FB8|nr:MULTISPECIES: zf-HC2 domain-containing protein [unclassified Arthrobacter]MCC3276768.1 zf-HC2 domain-containing protein [Arthrobacter sp. zg-Y20]MCC9176205.1 zf-HC2 domain-containing protein [Arthrobacter sp. zg-Y750]MDK1316926.1 zf-HC2 domain-containing protein [Arthrobacter sp. zg.Y20]WIB05357.1 zf-HC2 domain-containing protein [Arthrobacter sp. zg-Y20]